MAGLEVSCDGTTYGAECVIAVLAVGAPQTVQLRTTSVVADNEIRTVSIYGGSQVATVSVVKTEPDFTQLGAQAQSQSLSAFAHTSKSFAVGDAKPVGSYVGRARVRDIGAVITPATAVPSNAVTGTSPSLAFNVALTAEIYANPSANAEDGYYTIVLHDPSRTLLPAGDIVGTMKGHAPADFYDVEFHAQPWVLTTFASAARPLANDPEFANVPARFRLCR